MLKTTKAKIVFTALCLAMPLWAMPACAYALYLVATGKGSVKVTV